MYSLSSLITSDSTIEGKQEQEMLYLQEESIFTGNNKKSINRMLVWQTFEKQLSTFGQIRAAGR